MKVGIIGLPRSGKTTIFNILAGAHEQVGRASGKELAHLGTIKVPDTRLDKLFEIFQPRKKTHTEITFEDLTGADSFTKGKGFQAKQLTELRKMDSLVHVIRAFVDPAVAHPLDRMDPAADASEMDSELELADAIVAEGRIKRLEKENAKGIELDTLISCREHLDDGRPLRQIGFSAEERRAITGYSFLSLKPLLLLASVGDAAETTADNLVSLRNYATERDLTLMELCGKLEMEIGELEAGQRAEFMAELGIDEPGRDKFIRAAYAMTDLISFFTGGGKDEVRAWTIRKGTTAQEAAGKIHSDMARGFIRAEVIHFDEFVGLGTMAKAKELGKLRLEGKGYSVQDGDIVTVRFNV